MELLQRWLHDLYDDGAGDTTRWDGLQVVSQINIVDWPNADLLEDLEASLEVLLFKLYHHRISI